MSPAIASANRSVKMPPAASVSGPKSKGKPKPAAIDGSETVKPDQSGSSQAITPLDWEISIDRIAIHHNDRTEFDKKAIETLAVSIKERGLDNAITVRKSGEGFELIAGERRLRAAKSLGWTTIRARIIEADDKSADLLRLEENLLREDLNQIERAAGIKRYIEKHGESQSAVGKRFGMTQAQVSNLLRLLQLPEFWQDLIKSGKIPHTIARDVLCPWHHRPQLLEWVSQHTDVDDEQSFERDVLMSLIHQGVRSLTRSCRREAYFEFRSYQDHHCCFKLDDKNRHALDVEDSPSGEPRAWNVKAWEELNAPALKAYKERQKKDKAKHGIPTKSKGKASKEVKAEVTCDERKLRVALEQQLAEKLAAAIHPKKHKNSIIRLCVVLACNEDMMEHIFGEKCWQIRTIGCVNQISAVSDGDLPGYLCDAVKRCLSADYLSLDADVINALAAMLPVDLMHDWTPTDAILEAYSDSQLVAFAHDCEIDHTQSRLNLIFALTKPGVWQAGHVPAEVTAMVKGGK